MTYKEFCNGSDFSVIKGLVQVRFVRLSSYSFLIEVSLPTLPLPNTGFEWTESTCVVTEIEAYHVYDNLKSDGFE